MTRFGSCLLVLLLSLIAIAIVGCGSSRQLKTVALTPTLADAKDFPNGQGFIRRHRHVQQAPVPLATYKQGCNVVRRIEQRCMCGKRNPGRHRGSEWVGAMLTELHRNSHNPCRNGLILDGES